MLAIGLMSGTSMDGIDAALLETDGKTTIQEKNYSSIHINYDPRFKILLKAAEFSVYNHGGNVTAAATHFINDVKTYFNNLKIQDIQPYQSYLYGEQLKFPPLALMDIIDHSTQLHAKAVFALLKQMKLNPQDIDVVGYHGQTLFHNPAAKITVQVGNGKLLSELVKIPIIYDFRSYDLFAGGQGAPLAPIYHHGLCIRDKLKLPVAIVNCGGIANITIVTDKDEKNLIGFDTGPGNALIDSLIRHITNGKEVMDENGKYGSRGKVHKTILDKLFLEALGNYFAIKPPKSLDYNDIKLIPEIIELAKISLADACRTLEAFTAASILKSLDWLDIVPHTWILAGGGWHNPVIVEEFKTRLNEIAPFATITKADTLKWNNQALEAQLIAYLAVRSIHKLPISFPGTTAVAKPMTGGTYIKL